MRSKIVPFLSGVLIGLALSLLFVFLRAPNNAIEARRAVVERTLGGAVADGPREIEIVEGFLREVLKEVAKRPATSPEIIKATQNFISLVDFDPALAAKFPQGVPAFSVIVKADGTNTKILADWPLCGAAQLFRPKLLDPVRSAAPQIGCPYFGVWTDGAAGW